LELLDYCPDGQNGHSLAIFLQPLSILLHSAVFWFTSLYQLYSLVLHIVMDD